MPDDKVSRELQTDMGVADFASQVDNCAVGIGQQRLNISKFNIGW